jgi:hypothetical protein
MQMSCLERFFHHERGAGFGPGMIPLIPVKAVLSLAHILVNE